MSTTTQQKLAILRALRKGAKAVNAGVSAGRQTKKTKTKAKPGGACRGCPKLGRRRK